MIKNIIENWFILMVFSLLFGFFFLYLPQKANKALKKLSGYLNGSVSKFYFLAPRFEGKYNGLKFYILVSTAQSDATLPFLEIVVIKKSFLEFTIFAGHFIDNFWRRMGSLVGKKRINDNIFGKNISVFSNNPEKVINFLRRESIKKAIEELFSKGFDLLSVDINKIIIKKANYDLQSELEQSNILDNLSKLKLLSSELKQWEETNTGTEERKTIEKKIKNMSHVYIGIGIIATTMMASVGVIEILRNELYGIVPIMIGVTVCGAIIIKYLIYNKK